MYCYDSLYKLKVGKRSVKLITLFFAIFICTPLWGHGSENEAPVKMCKAVRVYPKPPKIDGVLDDEVWKQAPIASGFYQRDPNEGQPATEETAFQVAYDNEALYIAVLCSDSEPKKIVTRLYRRDQIRYEETDWVGIRLDTYHDHQTGFGFSITPSGSFADYTILNDSTLDWTWDGVWEVRTSIHNLGWSVELKIPYHALRFSPKEEYTWGINLERGISRKQEYDMWALVRRNESGISSRNGHLEGIMGIHPPAHLEILPYTVARLTVESASESLADRGQFFSNLGMDIRYGIASNISLNATLNPDFGQVEADPAVLNLSAFETYYEERRPFFIEGAGIFQTPFELFYSRRIGRKPGYFSVPAGFSVVSQPEFSTILGAAKLTGKTQGKTSFGIMEAVTASEYARIQRTVTDAATGVEHVEEEEHLIEPLTNYFAGRVQQDLLDGNSNAGVLLTAVNRQDAESDYTSGFDWNLKWRKNTYGFSGQVAGSRAGRSDNRKSGYATQFDLGKNSGWLTGGASFRAISPGFDANDLGFIYRADHIATGASIEMRKNQPWGPFRQMSVQLAQFATWNYKGVNRDNIWDFGAHSNLKNYWGITVWFTRAFQTLNDWKTRGGPLIVDPAWSSYSIRIGSDSRKRVTGYVGYSWVPTKEGPQKSLESFFNFHPTSTLEVSIGPSYSEGRSMAQWVTNVDSDSDGFPEYFVFGELTTNNLSLTTRANVIFTPTFSIQLHMQSFVAVGKYQKFKELAKPASYEFIPYFGLDFNPDFHERSLRSNLVLRWEYRPGSSLFLVWSQSRSASDKNTNFQPFDSLLRTFLDAGTNVFFVKLNYWLGM